MTCYIHEYILYSLLILALGILGLQSIPSAKLQQVFRQLHCDVVNSYLTSSVTSCAAKCLENIESCEGIALGKNSVYQVCSVKVLATPMEQFTMAYDFKIYTHVIHTEKGNHAGNQTIPVLNCTECVMIIEQFLTFYYYLSDQVIDICTLI